MRFMLEQTPDGLRVIGDGFWRPATSVEAELWAEVERLNGLGVRAAGFDIENAHLRTENARLTEELESRKKQADIVARHFNRLREALNRIMATDGYDQAYDIASAALSGEVKP